MEYNLTDASLIELRALDNAVWAAIEKKNEQIKILHVMMPEESETRNGHLKRYNSGLAELREWHVRILTSIDIVKNRESIQSN